MHNPYENIIIGNFLYGLGRAMGVHPRGVDGCVNLLQQTPLDPVLGDVMLHFPGAWRLIEFKRAGAKMTKEDAKFQIVVGATRRKALREASRRAHWFVLSGPEDVPKGSDPKQHPIRVCPYLEMHDGGRGIPLEQFAQEIVDEACSGRSLADKELDLYLTLMGLFGGLKGANTSGFLVGVSGSGGLTYVPVPNIADLRGTASQIRERMLATSLERDAQFQIANADRVRDAAMAQDRKPKGPSLERQIGMER